MTIHRIYVDSDGESHAEVLDGHIPPYGTPEPERTIPASGIAFLRRAGVGVNPLEPPDGGRLDPREAVAA